MSIPTGSSPGLWGLTGYQWTVVFAAWLGWGFDVFDDLLFNFVAPNCIPTLLGLPIGSPQARSATFAWTGILTSLLLLGWALGGTLFGKVADRIGRTRTLMLTMLLYLRDCGPAVRRSAVCVVALRVPERPRSGGRRPRRPLFREGTAALDRGGAGHAAADRRRALHARDPPADGERPHHRPDGARDVVELQRVHSRHRSGLAEAEALVRGLDRTAQLALSESWKAQATNWFNVGGLIGTLLIVPTAKLMGRRPMFALYFLVAGLSMLTAFGFDMRPETRIMMYFPIGLSVFGVFGSFTYYLPELFPTRLRGTGSGFCYNIGRVVAAIGPFLVGSIAARGASALDAALGALFWVGFVPFAGIIALRWVVETKGRPLPE